MPAFGIESTTGVHMTYSASLRRQIADATRALEGADDAARDVARDRLASLIDLLAGYADDMHTQLKARFAKDEVERAFLRVDDVDFSGKVHFVNCGLRFLETVKE